MATSRSERREWALMGHVHAGSSRVALKRWAAEKHGLMVASAYYPLAHRGYAIVYKPLPSIFGKAVTNVQEAEDEPTAVALALARALEEMGR